MDYIKLERSCPKCRKPLFITEDDRLLIICMDDQCEYGFDIREAMRVDSFEEGRKGYNSDFKNPYKPEEEDMHSNWEKGYQTEKDNVSNLASDIANKIETEQKVKEWTKDIKNKSIEILLKDNEKINAKLRILVYVNILIELLSFIRKLDTNNSLLLGKLAKPPFLKKNLIKDLTLIHSEFNDLNIDMKKHIRENLTVDFISEDELKYLMSLIEDTCKDVEIL